MKIALSGVQCVGKSTLLKEMENDPLFKDYNVIFECIRSIKDKIKINEDGDENTQITIMKIHEYNSKIPNQILDRCALDCMAYTIYAWKHNKIDTNTFNYIKDLYNNIINKYDVIFYIRPEFDIIPDGVRSLNLEFRDEVLEYFEELIKDLNNVVVLTGTVENRMNIIKNVINGVNND